jgi:hypothetical protein
MSTSIGAFTTHKLLAQPYGYEETATRDGLTARKWLISGLLTTSEWQSLLSVYNTWRDARIQDPDSVAANSVGTTVSLTTAANGISWSGIGCWFISAPVAEQAGAYVQATVELVDASQALQVALRSKEKAYSAEDRPNLGTYTVGTTVLTLLRPPETWTDAPAVARAASGVSYITGPLGATRLRALEGTTTASGWTALQSWYEAEVSAIPSTGDWFPVSPPTASAVNRVINGLKVIEYTVSLTLAQIL